MKTEEFTIHTDGGARGNPGPAACAFVAEKDGQVIQKESKFLGNSTNNFAEYQGVLLALRWMLKEFISKGNQLSTVFYLDSELVVRQLNGLYKIKSESLKKLYTEIQKLISENSLQIIFKHIPRSKNKIADYLVNKELDANV